MNQLKCVQCQSDLSSKDKFCLACGNPTGFGSSDTEMEEKIRTKTVTSTGNYSGTLAKGKKPRAVKILRNLIIAAILVGIIAVIIWFQVDPEAGKKVADVFFGVIFMTFFFLVGWLFMRGKKGKSNNWDDDHLSDVVYDDESKR